MTNDNLILQHLKAMRGDIDTLVSDMKDVKMRMMELERGMAMVLSGQAEGYGSTVRQQSSLDRF